MSTSIKFENISKQYRLGLVSTNTISHDLKRWWITNIQGKEDPYLKIGEVNDRAHKGTSDYVWALKDINFEVQQGDVLGIIGKNGAGKSTLLKILSKVTAPSTGTIKATGRIASLLEVGTGFHPEMTGRENIFMNGAIMGMTKQEINRKLDEIVDFSGVERYLDTPVKRYSSGMTVRLGFAIAAHLEPEILVVDEVLAVGDAEFQKKAIGKMQDVSRGDGRTVLFVSHNMQAVKLLCTTGVVLNNGSVSFLGSAEGAVDNYLNGSLRNDSVIIKYAKYCSSKIKINDIKVNGSSYNHVKLNSESTLMEISIKGEVIESCQFMLEGVLFDRNEIPVAVFSPTYKTSILPKFEIGNFCIQETIELPKNMNSGDYYFDLYLNHPMVEGLVSFEKSIHIEMEGLPTSNGFIFDYSKGYGYFSI
jgi:ABC-type polysaccharide/polyol phosphate transport system, ATPase component